MRIPFVLAGLVLYGAILVACESMPIPASSPSSLPLPTPPPAHLSDANATLERFMQARVSGDESAVLDLLSNRLRNRVVNEPIQVPLLQASNPCWYRHLILQVEETDPTNARARVRVFQHDWAGDIAGGLPQSWEQSIALIRTDARWRVDELGPETNRTVAPLEPHGLNVSACSVGR